MQVFIGRGVGDHSIHRSAFFTSVVFAAKVKVNPVLTASNFKKVRERLEIPRRFKTSLAKKLNALNNRVDDFNRSFIEPATVGSERKKCKAESELEVYLECVDNLLDKMELTIQKSKELQTHIEQFKSTDLLNVINKIGGRATESGGVRNNYGQLSLYIRDDMYDAANDLNTKFFNIEQKYSKALRSIKRSKAAYMKRYEAEIEAGREELLECIRQCKERYQSVGD